MQSNFAVPTSSREAVEICDSHRRVVHSGTPWFSCFSFCVIQLEIAMVERIVALLAEYIIAFWQKIV